jgi:two-component system nitrogen regulation response regulator GlnG
MAQNSGTQEGYDFDGIFKKVGEGRLYRFFLGELERPLIEWSLKRTWGNQVRAAKILGVNRNTIRSKIKKLGIEPRSYR